MILTSFLLVFASKFNSLTLDDNNDKKVTNWISIEIFTEKIKRFNFSHALIMSNLGNGKIILKFNKSVYMQKSSFSSFSNLISNLYVVYEFGLTILAMSFMHVNKTEICKFKAQDNIPGYDFYFRTV